MHLGFWNFYTFYNQNRMFGSVSAHGAGDDVTYGGMRIGKHLREAGHQVNTLDMSDGPFDAAIFFDHPTFLNAYYRRLRQTKTELYLFLMENELNRPDNYWKCNHKDFKKVFTWNPELADGEKYILFFHSMKIPASLKIDVRRKTKFAVVVAAQKYSTHKRALYKERIDVIRWYEREHPDKFDLYGQRWDRFYFNNRLWRLNMFLAKFYQKFPGRFVTHHFPSCRGPVDRKVEVMRDYKFAIVYENAVFPGYLTEKIFDAFFAGCVPVYLGAPDVLKYIPAETFVDRRNFADDAAVYQYLAHMSEQEYLGRVKAIENFVNGAGMRPYSADAFIELIDKHVVAG
jgi:alpha(1,3/1,4) fucosyltransferase